MPFTQFSDARWEPAAYKQAIIDSAYRALREALNVPEDDQFVTIAEHDMANFRYGARYLNVERSDVVVHPYGRIRYQNTQPRNILVKRSTKLVAESPGVRKEDVFVNILESAKQNWSLGNGVASFV